MRVAIVGSGIAGNVVAYSLRDEFDITVFEAANYIGGHTNTVDVKEDGRQLSIDTGFIVFNNRTYPNFIQILDDIGQQSQKSEMSFSVQAGHAGFEYCGSSLNAMFAQRKNLLRPSFYRMIGDILHFNKSSAANIQNLDKSETLGAYIRKNGYGKAFVNNYLVPMTAAIWSAQPAAVMRMPIHFLVQFFANHGLLQIKDRPQWRVIKGGSREYVAKIVAGHRDRIRLNTAVQTIRRTDSGIEIQSASGGSEHFDYVFVACHSDQALAMLDKPTSAESEILGAIKYQPNEAILHTDVSLMPKSRRAWAAWNYHIPEKSAGHVAVSYNMNILQRLHAKEQYIVTLNSEQRIDPEKVLHKVQYEHPIFSRESFSVQRRQAEINCDRTFYCGAYWKSGFHEDGVVSAMNAIEHFKERLSDGQLHLRRAS